MPDAHRIGSVTLRVTDLPRAVRFWHEVIGLTVLSPIDPAALGCGGRALVHLQSGATAPMPEMALGLFHVALQVPTREDLARCAVRLAAAGLRHSGQDHLVSESLYVADPDGNKIEITWLTPGRGTLRVVDDRIHGMTADGRPHSALEPLDLAALRATLPRSDRPGPALPPDSFIGHVHFRSRDLARSLAFYTEGVGLVPHLVAPRSHFCDAGTRPHPHMVALNTWAGAKLEPAAAGQAGLAEFTIEMTTPEAAAARLDARGTPRPPGASGFRFLDPDGNAVRLVPHH